jgi:hypothetical protein
VVSFFYFLVSLSKINCDPHYTGTIKKATAEAVTWFADKLPLGPQQPFEQLNQLLDCMFIRHDNQDEKRKM